MQTEEIVVTRSGWRVLVVESDSVVAKMECAVLAQTPGFTAVGRSRTARETGRAISGLKPDLVLLDLGLPDGDGLGILRRLRAEKWPVEVIVVAEKSSSVRVRQALHHGVVDFLVKPLTRARLRRALLQFSQIAAMPDSPTMSQREIDQLRRSVIGSLTPGVPRDLSAERVEAIRRIMARAEAPLSAEEVAVRAEVSRVTARRYLEYLVTLEEIEADSMPGRPGRPRKIYAGVVHTFL